MNKIIEFIKSLFGKKEKPNYVKEYTVFNYSPNEEELSLLEKLNAYRLSKNLKSLVINTEICGVCYKNNQRMINNGKINHDGSDLRFEEILVTQNAISVSENLAYNFKTADAVIQGWLTSSKHKLNLENPRMTHFGLAITTNEYGKKYYTNIFAKIMTPKQ